MQHSVQFDTTFHIALWTVSAVKFNMKNTSMLIDLASPMRTSETVE